MHARVSGTWRQILPLGFHVRVAGTWRQVQSGWVRVAGTWRQFFQAATYDVTTGVSDAGFAGAGGTNVNFVTNGTFVAQGDNIGVADSGNWVTPTSEAPGAYTIAASLVSGDTPGGQALDTDLDFSVNRAWTLSQIGLGSKACQLAMTLKNGGVTVATGTVTMDVTVFS